MFNFIGKAYKIDKRVYLADSLRVPAESSSRIDGTYLEMIILFTFFKQYVKIIIFQKMTKYPLYSKMLEDKRE